MSDINKNLTPFSLLAIVPPLFLSFFLNYVSSSYAEIDLFKLDLVSKKNQKVNQRLIFILKNNHLLFTVVCFIQVILNMLVSTVLVEKIKFRTIQEKTGISKIPLLFGIAFSIALFTEILARFLAIQRSNRKVVFSPFFINLTYLILRPFTFLQAIIKPRKRLFSDSEEDLIRFFNNLMVERVLEEKEVRLVQSALRFDELTINHLVVPYQKVVFLEETMSLEEVKKVYLQSPFTRYPVLNQKKEKVVGIISMKKLFLTLIEKKKNYWQNQIDKRVLYLSPSTKLNEAFEKSRTLHYRMLLVEKSKKVSETKKSEPPILGIITLHDILNSLVGKISHLPERPLIPSRNRPASTNLGSGGNPTNP